MASPATPRAGFVGSILAGRYRIVRLIGKGGMGEVYEAEHIAIGRRVAIKRLVSELEGDTEVFSRFRREAEVIAGFQHPNIVSVLDWVTTDDGSPCIVMEHLKGEDLDSRIARLGAMSWPELARIADEVLSALSVAHRAGIVHRDLKPQNIFLAIDDEGRMSAKLLDFGVSKIHASSTLATPASQMIGTPAYMAPEQARGHSRDVDAGTDIWAMGVVLFQMASGVLPFEADSVPATLYRICHEPPPALRTHRPDAPPELAAALEGCMARGQQQRTSSAESLRRELRAALSTLAPGVFRASVHKPAIPIGEDRTAEGHMSTLAAPISATAVAPTLPSKPSVTTTLSASAGTLKAVPRIRQGRLRAAALLISMLAAVAAIAFVPGALVEEAPATRPAAAAATRPAAAAAAATRPSPPVSPEPAIEPVALHIFSIASKPRGADVFDDHNRYLGITPLSYETSASRLKVTLRLDGYLERTIDLDAETDPAGAIELSREARTGRGRQRAPVESPAESTVEEPTGKKRLRGPYATDI